MAYWLVKTEPMTYSIDDFARDGETLWDGVRNYQARNFLRAMAKDDGVLIYHSSTDVPAIVGRGVVCAVAVPDPSQFDVSSKYFDPEAEVAKPRWYAPRLRYIEKFAKPLTRHELASEREFASWELLRKGSRLSVLPTSKEIFDRVLRFVGATCG